MRSPADQLAALLHDLRSWPQNSQEQARRNAMIAATDCTQRRVERQEVDDYFAALTVEPAHDASLNPGRARAR